MILPLLHEWKHTENYRQEIEAGKQWSPYKNLKLFVYHTSK